MKKKYNFITILSAAFLITACAEGEDNNTAGNEIDNNNNHNMEENNADDNHNMNEDNEEHNNNDHMNNQNEEGNNDEMNDHGHSEEQHEEFASAPENMNENASDNLMHFQTKNVTRLDADSPVDMSIYTSQLVWPATHEENQPGTVILAPVDDWQKSLVSTTLIHHPNDGPVLFMEDGDISEEVLTELERLNPKGNDNGTEVMVIGEVQDDALSELDEYNIEEFDADNAAAFAAEVDEYFSELVDEVPEAVLIASSEEEAKLYSLIASNWIAHMNESLLFVDDNGVPEETAEALEKRDGDAKMFLLGSDEVIGEDTIDALQEYGEAERIDGDSPEEMSIEFAKYRDEETTVGWGQEEPGHGLSFISTETPEMAITGSALGHLGKHAPLVWLEDGEISDGLYDYLADTRPTFEDDPMDGPYNHTYLLADTDTVTFEIQGILDEKLEIAGEHGDHGGHGGH